MAPGIFIGAEVQFSTINDVVAGLSSFSEIGFQPLSFVVRDTNKEFHRFDGACELSRLPPKIFLWASFDFYWDEPNPPEVLREVEEMFDASDSLFVKEEGFRYKMEMIFARDSQDHPFDLSEIYFEGLQRLTKHTTSRKDIFLKIIKVLIKDWKATRVGSYFDDELEDKTQTFYWEDGKVLADKLKIADALNSQLNR